VTDFSGKLLPWQNIARVVFFGVPFVCVPGWVVGASVYGIWAKGWRGWLLDVRDLEHEYPASGWGTPLDHKWDKP
jgi:hypothetical protein